MALAAALAGAASDAAAAKPKEARRKGDVFILPDGSRVDFAGKPEQASCVEWLCRDQADRVGFDACVAESCRPIRRWELAVETVKQEAEGFTVRARLVTAPGGYGSYELVSFEKPLWVGMTALDREGREVDAPAVEVTKPSTDQVVTLFAKTPAAKGYLVAAWEEKQAPCGDERPGCKEYGYTLDLALATYPPDAFNAHFGHEHIPQGEGPVEVRLVSSGASAKRLAQAKEEVTTHMRALLAPYGRDVKVVDGQKVKARCATPTVSYSREEDLGRAFALAERLAKVDWGTKQKTWPTVDWAESGPLTVCVGK